MSPGVDIEGMAGHEAAGLRPAAVPAAAAEGPFLWDWPSFTRCAKAFAGATLAVFTLAVAVGAFAPALPGRVLGAIESLVLWPGDWVSQLLPTYFVILLGNMKAAFITALLGPASVWVNARLNLRRAAIPDPPDQAPGWLDCFAYFVALGMARLGRRVFSQLGNARYDLAARSSAGLAAVVPFLALFLNGAVLGLWLAEGLLSRWLAGVVHVGSLLLPHAPVEFTALVLSAAIGLLFAQRLVPSQPGHDCGWQVTQVRYWLRSNALAQSLGLLVGLLAIAAALELVALVR